MKTTTNAGLTALLVLIFSCTKEPLHNAQATSSQTQDNSAVQIAAHYIGERFGGGIIFWLDSTGGHGLIADTMDLGLFAWYNGTFITTKATATRIGTGKANTRKIILAQGIAGSYAALACATLSRSGYTDWFLPSKDELNVLYKQKTVVGGFVDNDYWSSSENDINFARFQYFRNGRQYSSYKYATYYVRAVRAF